MSGLLKIELANGSSIQIDLAVWPEVASSATCRIDAWKRIRFSTPDRLPPAIARIGVKSSRLMVAAVYTCALTLLARRGKALTVLARRLPQRFNSSLNLRTANPVAALANKLRRKPHFDRRLTIRR